jgi:hypothetical protein
MVRDRSLQDVDDPWSADMVVDRPEYGSRLECEHAHSQLASSHALDLQSKVDRCQKLRRNTSGLRDRPFLAHRGLLVSRQRRISITRLLRTIGLLSMAGMLGRGPERATVDRVAGLVA